MQNIVDDIADIEALIEEEIADRKAEETDHLDIPISHDEHVESDSHIHSDHTHSEYHSSDYHHSSEDHHLSSEDHHLSSDDHYHSTGND